MTKIKFYSNKARVKLGNSVTILNFHNRKYVLAIGSDISIEPVIENTILLEIIAL